MRLRKQPLPPDPTEKFTARVAELIDRADAQHRRIADLEDMVRRQFDTNQKLVNELHRVTERANGALRLATMALALRFGCTLEQVDMVGGHLSALPSVPMTAGEIAETIVAAMEACYGRE